MITKRIIGLNENGNRFGEEHHRARLSDAQVEEIRELYEDGFSSYRSLAKRFGVTKATIRDIVTFRRRAHYAVRWKKV
jgi:DNA invertase Pin-like site-specific DNA recombinase